MLDKPGERLRRFQDNWEAMKASPELMDIIKIGYKIPFLKKPPLSEPQKAFSTIPLPEQVELVRRNIKDLVCKGAMRKVPWNEAIKFKGFYSKLFCLPKPGTDTWRVIINLKPLNQFIKKASFRMEGVRDVKAILEPGMFGAIVDLSDAYYHVSLHKKSRKYTRFIFEGVVYEYVALPMGLHCSPRIFTRVTKFFRF